MHRPPVQADLTDTFVDEFWKWDAFSQYMRDMTAEVTASLRAGFTEPEPHAPHNDPVAGYEDVQDVAHG